VVLTSQPNMMVFMSWSIAEAQLSKICSLFVK
jgi:hypothetical protein